MIFRDIAKYAHMVQENAQTVTVTSLQSGDGRLAVGIDKTTDEPFVALSHDAFNQPGNEFDLVIRATKGGPMLTIAGAVEKFDIDLFALARKLASDPETESVVGRSSLKLGQAPPEIKAD